MGGLNTRAADHQEVRLVALAQRAGPDGCGIQDHRDTFFTAHRRLGARTAIRAGQGGISMNGLTNEVTLARTVGLRAVHAYLRTNGWVRADSACRDTADVYLWPEDNREAAIVPASEGYADFGTRIYQIAEQIGRISGPGCRKGERGWLYSPISRSPSRISCACASPMRTQTTPSASLMAQQRLSRRRSSCWLRRARRTGLSACIGPGATRRRGSTWTGYA